MSFTLPNLTQGNHATNKPSLTNPPTRNTSSPPNRSRPLSKILISSNGSPDRHTQARPTGIFCRPQERLLGASRSHFPGYRGVLESHWNPLNRTNKTSPVDQREIAVRAGGWGGGCVSASRYADTVDDGVGWEGGGKFTCGVSLRHVLGLGVGREWWEAWRRWWRLGIGRELGRSWSVYLFDMGL